MNISISFPAISSEDVSEEPLIVEAEVEGYLNKGQVEGNPNGLGRVRWINIKTIGKIELEVKNSPSHSSTIYSMMKFPTPKDVATLVTRTIITAECRWLKIEWSKKVPNEREREVAATEEVLINPSFSDQKVTIGGGQ
nr:reverse transcriptase domain-containing protein [Tanacetum cinerariifolium]